MGGNCTTAIRPGTRVVRGPDWVWSTQDDYEGDVGTVMSDFKDQMVTVVWDSGQENQYRAGKDGKYDLRVFDSAPSGVVHDGIVCSVCGERNIKGFRWKCTDCDDVDLCTVCYMHDKHDTGHGFVRINTPNCNAFPVPPRTICKFIKAFGLFYNASVIRRPHWKWRNPDGQVGHILEVISWDGRFERGGVKVRWKRDLSIEEYRVGAEGCVDVMYAFGTYGGNYYPDHLPVVDVADPGIISLKPGDTVRVNLTGKVFHQLQALVNRNENMKKYVGELGTIVDNSNGICKVKFMNGDFENINRLALNLVLHSKIRPGTRVVRGPDWASSTQDDGEGFVGTVTSVPVYGSKDLKVTVIWDSGVERRYRAGQDGKYDLRVFDSAPSGIHHDGIYCDSCDEHNIKGLRWNCLVCHDFDLCTVCYMNDKHLNHGFACIETPNCIGLRVPRRTKSRSIPALGLFPYTEVIRGPSWKIKDQDGGKTEVGKILEDGSDQRGVVKVRWEGNFSTEEYRVGAEGCVDVIYTQKDKATSGGKYYPDHLPVVDVEKPEITFPKPGAKVRVNLTEKVFHRLQAMCGSWRDDMTKYIGKLGTVIQTLDRSCRVQYEDSMIWEINMMALECLKTTNSGLEIPSHWAKMAYGSRRVQLSPNAKYIMKMEYEEVAEKFKKTMNQATIVQIERVQNEYCWETYELLKRKMVKRIGLVNERYLYHGTDPDRIDTICKQNLDFRLAGENAGTLYGQGSYFARDAQYSDIFATPDDDGNKYMFLVKVLCGKMAPGYPRYKRPPPTDPWDPKSDLYDCCVDDVDDPKIFCLFDKNQYYPSYLIKYK